MSRKVDVAILGAGSAGLYALAQVRKKTDSYVLINGGELGTTCARVGCMPSKAMIQVADDFHRRKIFEREGIEGGDELSIDSAESMEHIQDLRDLFVEKVLGTTDEMDEQHLIDGYARFVSTNSVEVNGETIEAKKVVIATGTTPVVPDAWNEFGDDIITTDTVFELEQLPKSMAVIGLGSIGLELGQALSRMGVDVTGIDQDKTVAKLQDSVVNKTVIETIEKEFPLWLGCEAKLEKADNGIRVKCGDNEVVVEKILASLGRSPNIKELGLENTDLKLDDNGMPVYDPHTMQCGEASVFIAGDVDLDRALLHEAGNEGRIAGYNAVRDTVTAFRRKPFFAVTFCDPNIAVVGKQLDELNENEIVIGESAMGSMGRALIMAKNRGVIRIYAEKSSGLILGAAMACVKGENLSHLLTLAIQHDLTVFDLLKLPFYHPTVEEALQATLYSMLGDIDVKQEVVELEKI